MGDDGRCYRQLRVRGDSRWLEESMECVLPTGHVGAHRTSDGREWHWHPQGFAMNSPMPGESSDG